MVITVEMHNYRETSPFGNGVKGKLVGGGDIGTVTIQAGEADVSGTWKVKLQCPGATELTETAAIDYDATAWTVSWKIWNACPQYYVYKLTVWRRSLYTDSGVLNGYDYTISFDEVLAQIPQMEGESIDMTFGASTSNSPTFDNTTPYDF